MDIPHIMQVSGLTVAVHHPVWNPKRGTGLAACDPCAIAPVQACTGVPDDWKRTHSNLATYVAGVGPDRELWFDFKDNRAHTHEVAVVATIQDLNVLTGKRVVSRRLEHYRMVCPVHGRSLRSDRACDVCMHPWPYQNFFASSTHDTQFWCDHWRDPTGRRQSFVFNLAETDSYRVQFLFYVSRERKPRFEPRDSHPSMNGSSSLFDGDVEFEATRNELPVFTMSAMERLTDEGPGEATATEVNLTYEAPRTLDCDPHPLEYWSERPVAGLVLYLLNRRRWQASVRTHL